VIAKLPALSPDTDTDRGSMLLLKADR